MFAPHTAASATGANNIAFEYMVGKLKTTDEAESVSKSLVWVRFSTLRGLVDPCVPFLADLQAQDPRQDDMEECDLEFHHASWTVQIDMLISLSLCPVGIGREE